MCMLMLMLVIVFMFTFMIDCVDAFCDTLCWARLAIMLHNAALNVTSVTEPIPISRITSALL